MTTLEKLEGVFQEVLDDPTLRITAVTTARDVPGWDSLTHVALIVNAEAAFGVRFPTSDIAMLESVGDLVALIERELERSSGGD